MSLDMESERLREIPMFRDLDAAKCKLVAMSSDRLNYAPGDLVFDQGGVSDSVYFMLRGKVRVTRVQDDAEIELATLSGTAVLGETGVICGRARSARITAVDETIMLRTDANVFKELLHQVPQVAVALARELADRVDATSERLFKASLSANTS